MERISLTVPEPYPLPTSTVTTWTVTELLLQWKGAHIGITLEGTEGERREIHYNGETATSLMTILNKANLSVKSLHKRILEYLVTDGKITGTVTGAVD